MEALIAAATARLVVLATGPAAAASGPLGHAGEITVAKSRRTTTAENSAAGGDGVVAAARQGSGGGGGGSGGSAVAEDPVPRRSARPRVEEPEGDFEGADGEAVSEFLVSMGSDSD